MDAQPLAIKPLLSLRILLVLFLIKHKYEKNLSGTFYY